MKGTKKRIKKNNKRTKKGGFFSFFNKNKVAPEQNTYSNMKSDTLHQMYQEKCKKHFGFIKNMSRECKDIDSAFQKKLQEENNKKGNYIDRNDFDPSKSDRENAEDRYMMGVTLPPNAKSKFQCKNINLTMVDQVKNLKDIYGDCCPRGFFGKKNTSFCNNVEKKIEGNKYYYPEKPLPKEPEISNEEYENEREMASNPAAGLTRQDEDMTQPNYDSYGETDRESDDESVDKKSINDDSDSDSDYYDYRNLKQEGVIVNPYFNKNGNLISNGGKNKRKTRKQLIKRSRRKQNKRKQTIRKKR